jgi:uncharacterized coiled-coil protein SlyX
MLAESITSFGDIVSMLIQQYGITGIAFGGLLWLLWKNKKDADTRITELEKQADANQAQQIANYKEMIGEYVELVKNKTEVLAKLTTCLESMNNTLLRLEDKKQQDKSD